MSTPALCLFDLGDVAAAFRPERRLPELAHLLGATPEVVEERIWSSGLSRGFDAGDYSLVEMAVELGRRFDRAPEPEELVRVWCLAFEPSRSVLELAGRVRARARVGLLTNNPPAVEAGLPRYLPAVSAAFGPRFFSCSLGARKPAPEVFAAVEERTGLRPPALALIDDSERNVDAARRRGWAGVHFVGDQALRAELRALEWIAG